MSKIEKEPQRINTRISYELNEWLDNKSKEMAISKSSLVAIAVENYRKEVETISMLPLILKKLEDMGISIDANGELENNAAASGSQA